MALEIFFKLEYSEYGDGVMIEEYQGMFSLVAARQGKGNGTNYKKWGYPQYKDNPNEKAIPWKITLGNRQQALDIIKQIQRALDPGATPSVPPPVEDEDVPF